jgi:hypothetical protein
MKKTISVIVLVLISFSTFAQKPSERQAVLDVLARQNKNWNEGNISAFMEDYWKSDSLMFIGSKGVVYGWKATLDRYNKSYPDRATMGTLKFDIQNQRQMANYLRPYELVYWCTGKLVIGN